MPFWGHRGNSQVSGTSLCSLAASLTFVRLQLSPAWNPHLLRSCLWYALLLQQPQPCGIRDAVLPLAGSDEVPGGLGPDASRFSFSAHLTSLGPGSSAEKRLP